MGFRLAKWGYRQIEDEEPLLSRVLGLQLRVEGEMLRLVDPETGEKLLTSLEAQDARRRAEAEVERLRAELACLRGEATE